MLRIAFLLLVFANAAYWLWSHEHLAQWGLSPPQEGEPQRLAQQIRPEALRLFPDVADLPPEETPEEPPGPQEGLIPTDAGPANTSPQSPQPPQSIAQMPLQEPPQDDAAGVAGTSRESVSPESAPPGPVSPPPALVQCLQAEGIEGEDGVALRRSLRTQMPAGAWEILDETLHPGRWMVYMGRFENATALERARTDLRARSVEFASPGAGLEPGLSLGRFSTEQNAMRYMTILRAQGVPVSRVVQERADGVSYTLRLPAASAGLRAQVEALGAKVFAQTPLRTCPGG